MDTFSVMSDNMLDESDFFPLANSSEYDTVSLMHVVDDSYEQPLDLVKGRSADLLNAVKLHGNVPDRTAILLLELMKLPGFNPFDIKHSDIKSHESLTNTSMIKDVLRCHFCGEQLDNEQPCSQDW